MRYINHVLKTKGLLHSFERSAQVIARFSFGKKRYAGMMESLLRDFPDDVKVTFCVTGSLIEDHPDFFQAFERTGHKFAAHGYHHTDMKLKSPDEQQATLHECHRTFTGSGIPVEGFRCPYLSYNGATIEALRKSPFGWTSNDLVFWKTDLLATLPPEDTARLNRIYNIRDSEKFMSVPSLNGSIIEIPITSPDDEMLIERYRIRNGDSSLRLWQEILKKVHARGELFHLLYHPERYVKVRPAILKLIEAARSLSPGVWFTDLDSIAEWFKARRSFSWAVERQRPGRFALTVFAPTGGSLLINSGAGAEGFFKGYTELESTLSAKNVVRLETVNPSLHMIGLPPDAPDGLREFLADEGFIVDENPKRPDGDGLYLSGFKDFKSKDKLALLNRIDSSGLPLIRLWRWPTGKRSAFAISSDVDSVSIADFLKRFINF